MRSLTLERVVRFFIAGASISLIFLLVYNLSLLVGYAITAMVLSYLLDPVVNRIQAVGLSRTFATTLTLTTGILLVVFISTAIIPIIANQAVELTNKINIETLRAIAQRIEDEISQQFPLLAGFSLEERVITIISELLDIGKLSTVVSDVFNVFTNVFFAFLIIPFATFFFLKDGAKIRRDFLRLVPNKYFETTLTLIDKIENRLGVYFKSVLLQSFFVAVVSTVGLSIVGLENALSVGLAVGIANSIPYFGPIIGYFLSVVVSIIETGDFSLVAACLFAILLVQIMDNIIFQPLIFSKSADMHPVAILFIILIGAQLAGLLGMLIAIPLATIIKITVNQISWSFKNYRVFKTEISSTAPPKDL